MHFTQDLMRCIYIENCLFSLEYIFNRTIFQNYFLVIRNCKNFGSLNVGWSQFNWCSRLYSLVERYHNIFLYPHILLLWLVYILVILRNLAFINALYWFLNWINTFVFYIFLNKIFYFFLWWKYWWFFFLIFK